MAAALRVLRLHVSSTRVGRLSLSLSVPSGATTRTYHRIPLHLAGGGGAASSVPPKRQTTSAWEPQSWAQWGGGGGQQQQQHQQGQGQARHTRGQGQGQQQRGKGQAASEAAGVADAAYEVAGPHTQAPGLQGDDVSLLENAVGAFILGTEDEHWEVRGYSAVHTVCVHSYLFTNVCCGVWRLGRSSWARRTSTGRCGPAKKESRRGLPPAGFACHLTASPGPTSSAGGPHSATSAG